MIGKQAGSYSTGASYSDILGNYAGYKSSGVDETVMIGQGAGYEARHINSSVLIGRMAGIDASGAASDQGAVMIGFAAGSGNGPVSNYVGIGTTAGRKSSNVNYSIHIGFEAGAGPFDLPENGYDEDEATASGMYCTYIGRRAGYKTLGYSNLSILANGDEPDAINTGQGVKGGEGTNAHNWKFNIANVIGGDHADSSYTSTTAKRVSIGDINASPTATLQILPADTSTVTLHLDGTAPSSRSEPVLTVKTVAKKYDNGPNFSTNNSELVIINRKGFPRIPIFGSPLNAGGLLSLPGYEDGMLAITIPRGSADQDDVDEGFLVFHDGTVWRYAMNNEIVQTDAIPS
jgi:hypothetical protein